MPSQKKRVLTTHFSPEQLLLILEEYRAGKSLDQIAKARSSNMRIIERAIERAKSLEDFLAASGLPVTKYPLSRLIAYSYVHVDAQEVAGKAARFLTTLFYIEHACGDVLSREADIVKPWQCAGGAASTILSALNTLRRPYGDINFRVAKELRDGVLKERKGHIEILEPLGPPTAETIATQQFCQIQRELSNLVPRLHFHRSAQLAVGNAAQSLDQLIVIDSSGLLSLAS